MTTETERRGSTVRIGGQAGASFTTISSPIKLNISSDKLSRLPKDQRQVVNLIAATVQQNFTRWEHFSFQLPQTEFVEQHPSGQNFKPLVAVVDLCTRNDTSELAEITTDPDTGEQRRITPEQRRDIIQYGRFSFPSERFPHTDHVWQLPSWMVRGRKTIQKDFWRRVGYALDHIIAYIPNRFYQKPDLWGAKRKKVKWCGKVVWRGHFLSVAKGINRIVVHMKQIVAALVGLPETVPRRRKPEDAKLAEEQYMTKEHATCELSDYSSYFDYAISFVARYRSCQVSACNNMYLLDAFETFRNLSRDDLSTTKQSLRTQDIRQQQSWEESVQHILRDNRNGDEKTRLAVAEHAHAQHMIDEGTAKLRARVEREKFHFVNEAKQSYPILSLSHAWLEQWVLQKGVRHYGEWQRAQENENIALMRSNGLNRAAKFEEGRLKFWREEWVEIRASWLRERVAVNEYKHTYVIFDPRLWREGGISDVREVLTTTAHTGWRLKLLWRDMRSFLRNGLYFTIVTNLWRGPVGLQSLFGSHDVPCSWTVDVNGTVQVSMVHLSMYTRLQAIWRRVRELRTEFEEAEDTAFLGKDTVRWLHYIVNYGFRGGVSTALVIVGQPVLTVLNVAATVIVTATAVIWAPLSAFVAYCWSWLVFDWRDFERHKIKHIRRGNSSDVYIRECTESSPMWFPVPQQIFRIGQGVLEGLVSVLALALHPSYSIIRVALACMQRSLRMSWDSLWHGFLGRFGRWPSRDSFLAKRVSGVGVSGSYCFRLSLELVTRCVRARLEMIELNAALGVIEEVVSRPVRELNTFTENILTGLCVSPGEWEDVMLRLQNEEKKRKREIKGAFLARKTMLNLLIKMPAARERIRPEEGVPPEEVLGKCVEVVSAFYEERIAKLEEVSKRLWKEARAKPGDMEMLTKYLLTNLFSEQFLMPMQTVEKLEIPVRFEDVVNVYARPRRTNRYGSEGEDAC